MDLDLLHIVSGVTEIVMTIFCHKATRVRLLLFMKNNLLTMALILNVYIIRGQFFAVFIMVN
jgi:hypothetical protein